MPVHSVPFINHCRNHMAQTTHQKLAALRAQAQKISDEIASLAAKAALEVNPDLVLTNAAVEFEHGKGETKKTLTGVVVGRKDPGVGEKGGSQVKIAVGEGFDAAIYTVYVAAVTKIIPAAEPESTTDQPATTEG